jgi:hypothetical protein
MSQMTYNISPWANPLVDAAAWNPQDTKLNLIKGEMIIASLSFTDYDSLNLTESEVKARIKEKLVQQLAEHILKNKLVEFTQMTDNITGHKTVKARCFLVPDGQVRIIREYNK